MNIMKIVKNPSRLFMSWKFCRVLNGGGSKGAMAIFRVDAFTGGLGFQRGAATTGGASFPG